MLDTGPTLDRLRRTGAVARTWRRDHSLWRPGESGALAWLDLPESMLPNCADLSRIASEVASEGVGRVVLLGMGGSSLAPLALSAAFGLQPGFPELVVLDSTAPDWVGRVSRSSDPGRTLFVVSSKSGETTETDALYRYFRRSVESHVGEENAGGRFVAVTDPGSPLERLARRDRFRAVFLNPPGVVGRYSALSFFGLVPSALSGLDVYKLLERGAGMRRLCGAEAVPEENPGVLLGAAMGHAAMEGRDKLTLVTSTSIAAFGLWVEQLVAESTGKGGGGIVPVAGEPLMPPGAYGRDRLFVYLRLDGDPNAAADEGVAALEAAGHPVVRIRLADAYDLGSEFFRWEFATALAGAALGIYPFDQPDVELTKQNTRELLAGHAATGLLPKAQAPTSLNGLLAQAQPGDYLAIMAYTDSTPAVDAALAALRAAAAESHGIAATAGYGPRLLHSTGQLHKGGPGSGLFLQLTAAHRRDLPVPGKPYTFGALTGLQALADLAALESKARRVARVDLGSDPVSALSGLRNGITR